MPPLNGTKTHPLKPKSIAVLRDLAEAPVESCRINPGVRDRLTREGLAEEHAPTAGVNAARRCHRITDAGRKVLASLS
jgi:hypothetical protein